LPSVVTDVLRHVCESSPPPVISVRKFHQKSTEGETRAPWPAKSRRREEAENQQPADVASVVRRSVRVSAPPIIIGAARLHQHLRSRSFRLEA
jgi:hypothetical protein